MPRTAMDDARRGGPDGLHPFRVRACGVYVPVVSLRSTTGCCGLHPFGIGKGRIRRFRRWTQIFCSFPGSCLGTHLSRRLQPPSVNGSNVRSSPGGKMLQGSRIVCEQLEAGASKTLAFPGRSLGTSPQKSRWIPFPLGALRASVRAFFLRRLQNRFEVNLGSEAGSLLPLSAIPHRRVAPTAARARTAFLRPLCAFSRSPG